MIESVELITLYFGATVPDVAARFERLRDLPADRAEGRASSPPRRSYDWMYRGGSAEECADLAPAALEGASGMEVDTGLTWVVANVVLDAAERRRRASTGSAALARSHKQGSMFGVLTCTCGAGSPSSATASCPAAEESLRAGIEQISLLGGATLNYAHGLLCSTLLARGRVDDAAEALYEIERPDGDRRRRPALALGRDRAAARPQGMGGGARRRRGARRALRLAVNPAFAQTLSFKARALEGLDRVDEAIGRRSTSSPRPRHGARPAPSGAVLRVRGELRREDGVEDLERAVELLEDSPMRLELAHALASLGGIRRRASPKEAREPLRRAYELAEVCGAAELRPVDPLGAARDRRPPRGSALKGPGSLTPSERRVTDLAVEG